jgi:preprotein translocase subunit SecB
MKVQLSPLQLKNILIEKERIEVYPKFCNSKEKIQHIISINIDFGKVLIENDNYFDAILFELEINKNKRKVPFKIYIKCVAVFEVNINDEQKKEKFLVINGSVMIYGFLRGYLYEKLGILPSECRIIPSINLLNLLQQKFVLEKKE